jgi:hypothetical protein
MIDEDNLVANHVVLENTIVNKVKLPNLAKKIAMLAPTLIPIKVPV